MARMLYNDDWFEEISSHGHYEAEFEKILQQESDRLFRSYHFVPFKTPVASELDCDIRVPDFALVHKSYHSWWIVEVELGHHSLKNHVLPQVRTFARARYGSHEADYLCRQEPSLHREKILDMFKGDQPHVLVIVNSPVRKWAEALRPFGAKVVVCQMFRNRFNNYMLRLNGEYPAEGEQVITRCECVPILHRMVTIHSPANLPMGPQEKVLLYHKGTASEWQRVDTATAVFLLALRDHSLKVGRVYEIIREESGTLVIRSRSGHHSAA